MLRCFSRISLTFCLSAVLPPTRKQAACNRASLLAEQYCCPALLCLLALRPARNQHRAAAKPKAQLLSERDLDALARANGCLYCLLNTQLYRRNAQWSGSSALVWAVCHGQEATLKRSLEGRGRVQVIDTNNRTPLSLAAENGHDRAVDLLLRNGADTEATDTSLGWTPLAWATWQGHIAVVKLLLEASDGNADYKGHDGDTLLSLAVCNGDEAMVKLLLRTTKVNVDLRDNDRHTPLMYAASGRHNRILELLLATGRVDIDARNIDGRTPLIYAALGGSEAVVRMLLETSKANTESKDLAGQTALSWAGKKGHHVILKLLTEASRK